MLASNVFLDVAALREHVRADGAREGRDDSAFVSQMGNCKQMTSLCCYKFHFKRINSPALFFLL